MTPLPFFSIGQIISLKKRYKSENQFYKIEKILPFNGKYEYFLSFLNSDLKADKRKINMVLHAFEDDLLTEFRIIPTF